jgi:hypothetical protein
MSDQTVLQVGVGKQYQTINAAILAADNMGGNADIKIDAGTYTNDGGYLWDGINNVTIEGVGGMVNIVDPTYYAGGKAAIVTGGQNIVLKNLDISGVTVPDGNGAAVRYDQGTLLLDNVHFHNNQNGILGAADITGSITIQNSEIDHNGTSAGNTHNIYIGDIGQFTLTNSYIHDANVGHEVKSRAENNTITNNRIEDNSGTSSYAIDLPNGGNATITGNVIEQGANGQNHIVNAYGEEGNLHAGAAVTFSNNQVVNDNPVGAGPLWSNNGATITGTGNTVWNLTDLGNGVSPSGFTQLSARPNLDTTTTPPAPDTTPPTLTAGETISGVTNATSVTISGTVSDAQSGVARVEVYDSRNGHQADLGAATIGSDGRWTFAASGLANGTHQFAAAATDAAGNATAQVSAGAAVTVDTVAPQPVIKIITGIRGGGVTLAGVSEANSTVTVTDTVNGRTTALGTATASSTGAWQLTSNARVDTSKINAFSVSAHDAAGNAGAMPGMLFLSSTGADTFTAAPGVSEVFSIMSFQGSDVINGFQTASAAGSAHDYINFSGRGITSFSQVQSMMSGTASAVINIGSGKSITLTDVAPTSLTAADFRYS